MLGLASSTQPTSEQLMQKRKLGSSILEVTVVGLGGNNFGGRIDFDAAQRTVHAALDLGINLIDTADTYGNKGGSEEALGRILGKRRKGIVLATKFGLPMDDAGKLRGASRGYVMRAVEASLRRLRTDWIDLYQLHRPDAHTPIEETLRALDDLIRQGKVRFIGCSNLPAPQLIAAHDIATRNLLTPFITCQDEYSLLARGIESELIPAAKTCGMSVLPYFPLASGLLTGKYKRGAPLPKGTRMTKLPNHAADFLTERNWRIVDALQTFASKRGRTLIELAFSWLLRDEVVASVIAGATSPEQVAQNIRAAEWALTAEELAEVDRITL
jgi:aryl-alcohol dehydrogenase-like predicted oxidoreductase